jgi:hypothetical protein
MRKKIPEDYIGPADEQEVIEEIYDHFITKEWWILMIPWSNITDNIQGIENTYYPPKTEANRDFKIIFSAWKGTIILMKKSRMTKEQLQKYVAVKLGDNTDVFCVVGPKKTTSVEMDWFQNLYEGLEDVHQARGYERGEYPK